MATKRYTWWTLLLLVSVGACVEPFETPVQDKDVNFLVVDGFLNTTNGTANVKLSRASVLHDAVSTIPEENAQVEIEDNNGSRFPLIARGLGVYDATHNNISLTDQYRIYILTTDGKEYRSKFITPKVAPPIDELAWVPTSDGVHVRVDTHDDSKQSRYYRWDFVETWEYRAPISSDFLMENGEPRYRLPEEQIWVCYRSLPSSQILTTSTVRLSEDRVNDFDLTFLPRATSKLGVRYSILVRQFAMSQEAYEYWEELKKTTESLGGLFDPQPGKVTGNMANIADDSEVVIGYFDAGSASEKRLFIRFSELPTHLKVTTPFATCTEESIGVNEVATLSPLYLITSAITEGITVIGYRYTTTACADCRYQGGSIIKPEFW
jgi:hypothetical protein